MPGLGGMDGARRDAAQQQLSFAKISENMTLSMLDPESSPAEIGAFGLLLDRIGLGCVMLNDRNEVVQWNASAKTVLGIEDEKGVAAEAINASLKRLIADASSSLRPGAFSWIVIPCLGGQPVVVTEELKVLPPNFSVVFLLDRSSKPQPNRLRLQKLFDLTGAETAVALNIATGKTLLEIANQRRLSLPTVRSQLASLFAKTDTRRQSELRALLQSLAILP